MFWGGAFLLTNLLFGYSFLKHFCERANFSPLGRGRENLFQLQMALAMNYTLILRAELIFSEQNSIGQDFNQ